LDEKFETDELGNAAISERCARGAERVSGHLGQAFRRAARKALLWAEEARDLVIAGRSLSELNGIGPFLARQIRKWIDESLDVIDRPPIRQEFLTLTEARRVLSRFSKRQAMVRGDLHMHTVWSGGSVAVAEMVSAVDSKPARDGRIKNRSQEASRLERLVAASARHFSEMNVGTLQLC
jgi:hypothetical protein